MSTLHIVYWSASGNTEAMANAVAQGARDAGAEVILTQVSQTTPEEALAGQLLALGCPAMGDEVLEESEFEPFFLQLEPHLSGRKVALFGSYGWGDGQWMRDWQARTEKDGAILFHGAGLILNDTPDDDGLAQCRAFGRDFAGQ